MLEHYEASAKQEIPFGALGLAELYHEGRFVPQDWSRAYDYYEKAVEIPAFKAIAHFQLGQMHEFGRGVPITYTEAAYHYRLAALEGHVQSLRLLINFYVTGTGVSRDFDRAVYWLDYMRSLNQVDALPIMVDVLLKKQDYTRAIKLLEVLGTFPDAQISGRAHKRLSLCYSGGLGVKQNLKRAEKHLKIAIEKGNGNALTTLAHRQIHEGKIDEAVNTFTRAARNSSAAAYNLGQMYFFGTHVAINRTKGIQYIGSAANNNHPDAQYFLAGLTWNNEPGAPSVDEAITLAQKAENLGNPKAAELREKLEKRRKASSDKPEENTRTRSS